MKNNTLYGQIIIYIKDSIKKGRFLPHQKIPTELELVEKFHTSRPTVNRALSELSIEGLIYRIQGKGSFVADPVANEKRRNNVRIVTLITPFDAGIPERIDEIEIIRGAESYLKEKGYFLSIQFTGQDAAMERQLIKKSRDETIDGIILYPSCNMDSMILISELYMEDYPIVILDRNIEGIPIPCVQSDNKKGGYQAAKHLVESGYKEIFFISDLKMQVISSVRDRYLGYCSALKEVGIRSFAEHCIDGFALTKSGTVKLFNYEENPDTYQKLVREVISRGRGEKCGIFADNDPVANALILAALELGVDVPDELGIVGFDDTGYSTNITIPITTVRQNFYEIGRISADTIVKRIENKGIEFSNMSNIYIDTELVIRKSTSGGQMSKVE